VIAMRRGKFSTIWWLLATAILVVGWGVGRWQFGRRSEPSQQALTLAAIANLHGRARENVGDGLTHAQIGMLYARLGRWEDALPAYRKATELSPTSLLAWTGLGQTYNQLGRPGSAIRAFEQAALLEPNNREVLLELSRACLRYRRFKRSLAIVNDLLRTNPRDVEAYTARATIYYVKGDRAKAFDDVKKAQTIAPDAAPVQFMLARLNTLVGNYREAEAAARRSIELAPNSADGYVLLAALSVKRSWNESVAREVERCARQALKADPRSALGQYYLGYVRMRQNQLDEAERALTRAEELDPREADILFALGQTLVRQGKQDEGKRLLERYQRNKQNEALFGRLEVQSEGNPDPLIHFRLAQLYDERGMFENAAEHLEMTLQSAPQHQPARRLLAEVYRKLGATQQAEKVHAEGATP
jgi:tetratricopeptide (TPR) repeat protein